MELAQIIDQTNYLITDPTYQAASRHKFNTSGVLVMPGFVRADAIASIHTEGQENHQHIWSDVKKHNVYLSAPDPEYPADHPRNRTVTSSKGCLTDDQVPVTSALRTLYNAPEFRAFLCAVLGEDQLFEYADPLSSINLHFAETGQELGWHFDNSSFAITLMVQPPETGGQFEYVTDVRDADAGEMSYTAVTDILDGRTPVETINVAAGTLVFFRGRNSMHRVAPNLGARTRVLAVLAYNTAPGIALSEEARMTFYGRTG